MKIADDRDPQKQYWGIYFGDPIQARVPGNRLRTVVRAYTKQEAENLALNYGFRDPNACQIEAEDLVNADWLPACWRYQKCLPGFPGSKDVSGKTHPTRTSDLAAIATLYQLRERIRSDAVDEQIEISESHNFERFAGRIEVRTNAAISRIEEVIQLLERGRS